jgi:predicted O-linked N-acetylglucosamine transferase (SPINDLY family)
VIGGLSHALYSNANNRNFADDLEQAYYYGCKAYEIVPDDPRASMGLSQILLNMLRVREGMSFYDRAVKLKPDSHNNVSSCLFHDNYTWYLTREESFERHQTWGRMIRKTVGAPRTNFDNVPDVGRRLRVGFVSADFMFHPVSYFFFTLFRALKEDFDIYLYSNLVSAKRDDMTRNYEKESVGFHDIEKVSDEDFQKQAIEDGIDVMIDLSGHTSGNRLPAFARRLAPVQVSWLGYPNTTGLDTMDYRISDNVVEPENDADRFSSERIVRLPGGFHLYRPTYTIPDDVGPLPALKNGFVTFGSFNNLKKASPLTLQAWAHLMKAVPGSHLVIKDRNLENHYTRERIVSLMASYGISPSRVLVLRLMQNNLDHMCAYRNIDIAMDCFPYNGTTTTCEALYMGCPVLTIEGDRHVSRVSTSILTHTGHPEWIARDEDHFVEIGRSLVSDLFKLAEIRSHLREQLNASPLCDTGRMHREFVDAIRGMWKQWCAKQGGGSALECAGAGASFQK